MVACAITKTRAMEALEQLCVAASMRPLRCRHDGIPIRRSPAAADDARQLLRARETRAFIVPIGTPQIDARLLVAQVPARRPGPAPPAAAAAGSTAAGAGRGRPRHRLVRPDRLLGGQLRALRAAASRRRRRACSKNRLRRMVNSQAFRLVPGWNCASAPGPARRCPAPGRPPRRGRAPGSGRKPAGPAAPAASAAAVGEAPGGLARRLRSTGRLPHV